MIRPPREESEKKSQGIFHILPPPGRFKDTLQAIISAERPSAVNRDFIETVLGIKGGIVSGFPPILKRIGFLSADNSPTELYGQFQAEGSRSYAALTGLKNGFAELFKRNAHADRAEDDKIKDYLVQITGRKRDDGVISAILGTFNAIRSFIVGEILAPITTRHEVPLIPNESDRADKSPSHVPLGLSYHINVVLPETKDIAVFNAIFQSLKQNLLS